MREEQEHTLLVGISVLTVAAGAAQAVMPGALLEPLSVEISPATQHLFGTVGMFR